MNIYNFLINTKNNFYDFINYIHFYKIKQKNKLFNKSNIDYNNIIYNDILYKYKIKVNIYNLKLFNNYIGLHHYQNLSYNDNQLNLLNNNINVDTLIKFVDSRIIIMPNYTYIQNYFENNNKLSFTKKFYIIDIDDYFIYVKLNNDIIDLIQINLILFFYFLIYIFGFYNLFLKIKNFF
jgi:hypothetical protein